MHKYYRHVALMFCFVINVPVAEAQVKNDRYLILTNGQMIEGQVIELSDKYSVLTEQGSRLVIEKSQVDFTCASIIEAYWQKNARLKATDLEGHQRLFHWCLKHKLLEQAQNQIDIISILPIKATKLEYIHRQLVIAIDMRARKIEMVREAARKELQLQQAKQSAAIKSQVPNIRPLPSMSGVASLDVVSSSQPERSVLADSNGQQQSGSKRPEVAQVAFSAPIRPDLEGPEKTDNEKQEKKAPTIDELDALTKSLPKPAVAMFKRKIEPLIVRSCFASKCHQTEDEIMPLMRVSRGQLIPRRMSQRNLHSILKHADPNLPLESRLLSAAMTSHGGLEEPIIKPASVQFDYLTQWLIMVSNKPYSVHQMPERDIATLPGAPIPDSHEEPPPAAPVEQSQPALAQPPPPQRDILDKLKDIAKPELQDPRDPTVFNRLFRKKK